jgi:Tfp pilus assembly protein PilF
VPMEIQSDLPTSLLMSYLLKAQDAQERGDRQTASKFYTLALQIDPDCAGALNNLAMILAQNEHHVAAAVLARRAVANSPDQMYIAANCGMILSRNVAFAESRALFERLVAEHPQDADFWHGLGIAHVMDDVGRAIECFERALELSPDSALVLKNLGLARLAVRDWDVGFAAWRRSGLDTTEDAAFSPLPQWRGQDLKGKTIVVHHEQG